MRAAIIAGGRNYILGPKQRSWLDGVLVATRITHVITGGAEGADQGGADWAKSRNIETVVFPADWKKHGRSAGPLRNEQMAKHAQYINNVGQPLCIIFPGGIGTASMKRIAILHDIRLLIYVAREGT